MSRTAKIKTRNGQQVSFFICQFYNLTDIFPSFLKMIECSRKRKRYKSKFNFLFVKIYSKHKMHF